MGNLYHINAGAGPVSSTTSLDNVGFSKVSEGSYNQAVNVKSPELARLLGVPAGGKVFVAEAQAAEALKLLDQGDVLNSTKATVYEGAPSMLGTVGDFLWGNKVREN